MKKAILLFFVMSIIPLHGFTQTLDNLDYIAPFKDDVAAIKKGDEWGFINRQGDIVVDFRNDLVITKSEEGDFPVFSDDRCIIEHEKDGISYFGYIDKSGKTVIEPQFLNATNFKDNLAIAIELRKEASGKHEVLDKEMYYYKYYDVMIATDGSIQKYITRKGVNIALDKRFIEKPLKLRSKRISDDLVAIKNTNGTWMIQNVN